MDQNVDIDEWSAKPIPPEGRGPALKEQRSFARIADQLQSTGRRFCWWIAGTSNIGTLIALSALAIVVYRNKTPPPEFIVLNHSMSGMAYEAVPASVAVKLFDSSDRQDDVQKYITNRLGYVDVLDREQWATVRAMSSPACFLEYDADRKLSFSPNHKLNTDGHIVLSDWMDDPHPIHSPDDAWSYTVTLSTQEVKGKQIQMIKEPWRVTVTFRYQPDMHLNPDDRRRNRRGFQCIKFTKDPLR